MNKYLVTCVLMVQVVNIFSMNKRTSDPKLVNKDRSAIHKTQPISLPGGKNHLVLESKRSTQSITPDTYTKSASQSTTPNDYFCFGGLSEDFSPTVYDSSRR